jgi:hypothetical protein
MRHRETLAWKPTGMTEYHDLTGYFYLTDGQVLQCLSPAIDNQPVLMVFSDRCKLQHAEEMGIADRNAGGRRWSCRSIQDPLTFLQRCGHHITVAINPDRSETGHVSAMVLEVTLSPSVRPCFGLDDDVQEPPVSCDSGCAPCDAVSTVRQRPCAGTSER